MLKLNFVVSFLLIVQILQGQKCSISGYIGDRETGERLIGAYILDTLSKTNTQSNSYGFFNLRINGTQNVVIIAKYMGMKSKEIKFSLRKDTIIEIKINPIINLNEVIVASDASAHNVNSPLGTVVIPVSKLTLTPSLGEMDILKAIQIQPGIKGGIEGSSGIYVRGGSAGENQYMLDDAPMYNVNHLYGFFSAFNTSSVKNITVIKGCFSAKYGGRVSSVIDVRSRDGDNSEVKGEVSVGIVSSKLNIEGPLFNNKTTFNLSARRSYFDSYSGFLKKKDLLNKDFPLYYFYDLNFKLTHSISENDKLFINFYSGKDKITNNNDNSFSVTESEEISDNRKETSGWGNLVASLRWNHTFKNNLFVNSTIATSNYNYYTSIKYNNSQKDKNLKETIIKDYSALYRSYINDLIIKSDFEYALSNSQILRFGIGNTFHSINPGRNEYLFTDYKLNIKSDTSYSNYTLKASELFSYLENEVKVSKKLGVIVGVRFSAFISDKFKWNIEPRLSVNYAFRQDFVMKGGFSRMVQYMHLLSSSGLSLPTDIWIPALKNVNPLKSDQINLGFSYLIEKKALISVDVYKKWLYDPTDYKNGSSLLIDLSPWYDKVTQGQGKSSGIEISIEKQAGKLTGAINYTLSTASRQYNDLNDGKFFPFDYDRRHDFNISTNYRLSDSWNISAIWLIGSGYPVTLPVEKYLPMMNIYTVIEAPSIIYYYPSINNYRLPAYHRLDLGIHYKKKAKKGVHYVSLDVFNAYNRKNPVGMYYWLNYTFKYSYLLPIIPSITYTFKFE
jgi:hypothetical protein